MKLSMILTIGLSAFFHFSGAHAAMENISADCNQLVEKLCPGLSVGHGLIKCIEAHKADFANTPCAAEFAKARSGMKDKMKAVWNACKGDIKTHCASVKHGSGRIIECLQSHAGEISPTCQTTLKPSGT